MGGPPPRGLDLLECKVEDGKLSCITNIFGSSFRIRKLSPKWQVHVADHTYDFERSVA